MFTPQESQKHCLAGHLVPAARDAVIGTKVRFACGTGPNDTGLSRHHIIESCHASLKRLGTDYIDLYQIHSYDPGTPLEETLRALDDLVCDGKIRYTGCSNLAAWQMMKALALADKLSLERFVTSQLYYSPGMRDIEHELSHCVLDQKIGSWLEPSIGRFLYRKYRRNAMTPENARRSRRDANPCNTGH
jgi:aryl-alcohol dehydrogenase-like predicted oxidoreductase